MTGRRHEARLAALERAKGPPAFDLYPPEVIEAALAGLKRSRELKTVLARKRAGGPLALPGDAELRDALRDAAFRSRGWPIEEGDHNP